jgi:hypothetical protein
MPKSEWPAWYSSPNGDESEIFKSPEDVPTGWTTGAEKQAVKVPAKSKAKVQSEPEPSDEPMDL